MTKRNMVCDSCKKTFTCSNHCKQNLKYCLCYECDVKRGARLEWLEKCNKPLKEKVIFT